MSVAWPRTYGLPKVGPPNLSTTHHSSQSETTAAWALTAPVGSAEDSLPYSSSSVARIAASSYSSAKRATARAMSSLREI